MFQKSVVSMAEIDGVLISVFWDPVKWQMECTGITSGKRCSLSPFPSLELFQSAQKMRYAERERPALAGCSAPVNTIRLTPGARLTNRSICRIGTKLSLPTVIYEFSNSVPSTREIRGKSCFFRETTSSN